MVELQPRSMQSSIDKDKITNDILLNGAAILQDRLGNENGRLDENSEILTDKAFTVQLLDGFETVVVPVKNTMTEEVDVVILGSTIDGEDVYPVLKKSDKNISVFELSNRIIEDSVENDGSVQFCSNETVLICELELSCVDNVSGAGGPCWFCEAFEASVGDCPTSGSIDGSDGWGGNDNSGDENEGSGSNNGEPIVGEGSSSSGNQTIEETIELSYTTEQILLELEDCTDKTVQQMSNVLPLTTDKAEFLTSLLLNNIHNYNNQVMSQPIQGISIENVPTYEDLEAFINSLDVSSFAELIEEIVNYLQFYNEYGDVARTIQPNFTLALSCYAWSGLFEVNFLNYSTLKDMLQNDPYFLFEECIQQSCFDINDYYDLFNFDIQPSTQAKLDMLNMENQTIEEGNAIATNVDDYAVEITSLPPNKTIEEVFSEFRSNFIDIASGNQDNFQFTCNIPFHLNNQANISWEFNPYEDWFAGIQDAVLWQSDNPLDAIFLINTSASGMASLANDEGAVITSSFEECCWVFSTIKTDFTNTQPFSGNRQFGYRLNDNGNYEIYTKAIDIAKLTNVALWGNLGDDSCVEDDYYNIANATWENLQSEVQSFINNQGGIAQILQPKVLKFDNESIRQFLTSPEPLNQMPCQCE